MFTDIKVSHWLLINKNDKPKVIILKKEGKTVNINKTKPGVKMTPFRSSRGGDKSRSPSVKDFREERPMKLFGSYRNANVSCLLFPEERLCKPTAPAGGIGYFVSSGRKRRCKNSLPLQGSIFQLVFLVPSQS